MSNSNESVRRLLSGMTGSELQNLVNIRESQKSPVPAPRKRAPIPTPRDQNVRQLIQDNPIPPYRPIPAPRIEQRNNKQYQPLRLK